MNFYLYPSLVGALGGGLGVFLVTFLRPRKNCPKCQYLLPRFRNPRSFREAMLGGWHCPSCGTQVARNGKALID